MLWNVYSPSSRTQIDTRIDAGGGSRNALAAADTRNWHTTIDKILADASADDLAMKACATYSLELYSSAT